MVLTCVYIHVKEEFIESFKAASLKNHQGSIQEEGNLRFDLIQNAEDPSKFMFYEVYKTEADVKAHKETPHYLTWRDTVADWMAEPRRGIRYNVVAPVDSSLW